MQIRITAAAEQEIDEAVDWYRQQQAGLEEGFLREFRATVARIQARPEIYPELKAGIRRGLMRRFPYSVIYESDLEVLMILAVAHHGEQLAIAGSRHWLMFESNSGVDPSPAEIVNLFLLSLWLVKPTNTHAGLYFQIDSSPEADRQCLKRLNDRFAVL